MIKHICLIMLAASLSACGNSTVEEIRVSAEPVEKPVLTIQEADELNLRDVEWTVLTPENFEGKIKLLSDRGSAAVFFALTAEGYEKLSLNINDLRTHIEQKNSIILAYRRYYVQSETVIDQANRNLKDSFLR